MTLLCALFAVQALSARRPAGRFDVPCRIEYGKYVVEVGTPAGPRRFIFDTGASRTTVSEKLCRELGLPAVGQKMTGDFEGYRERLLLARIPFLQLGEARFDDWPVAVVPDT
ncbi:MAG: retroviral-like aspartic protease family protein, partial [Alistipes sp.]|nr:retroviral-like aspartic protease family protein [Alistipes sp.]